MGFIGLFNKNAEPQNSSVEFNFEYVTDNRNYLKKMALETVVGYIARSFASSEFKYSVNKKGVKNDLYYKLNVRPNTDQSASEFWYQFIFKLIYEGQVLVIISDDNQLLIADSFQRTEYALVPDVFSNVKIKNFNYNRTFSMDDVIYLRYGNQNLNKFMSGMFDDYTDLFNRMIEGQKLSNQYRAKVNIDANLNQNKEQRENTQKTIDKMFNVIKTKAIAFLPVSKGFDFTEISNGNASASSSSVEGLTRLKNSLIDEVSDILGVPQGLVHGQLSDVDSLIKAFLKFCINPLNKMVEDELNAKIIGIEDYLNGEKIDVKGIRVKDLFENANNVDKLISSGVINRTDAREELGLDYVDNPELDKYLITKNYGILGEENTGG